MELELMRSRSFTGSFVASMLYYAGFGAWLLSLVEFLTGVWHFSAVQAGLAIAPGPLMVLPFARAVAPRLATRIGGPGRVAMVGCAFNLGAQVLWLTQIRANPDYVSHLLPVQLLGGAGVGLSIPSLLGAGSESLPPARFGTGSGILNMARQIGTVFGVAGLIAVLSHVTPGDPVAAFRHGVILVIGLFASALVVSGILLSPRTIGVRVPDPAPVSPAISPSVPTQGGPNDNASDHLLSPHRPAVRAECRRAGGLAAGRQAKGGPRPRHRRSRRQR